MEAAPSVLTRYGDAVGWLGNLPYDIGRAEAQAALAAKRVPWIGSGAAGGPFVSASAGHGTSESPNSRAATTWWTGSLCFARTVRGRSIRSHREFSFGRVEMMNPA